ncbi:MAG: sxtJ [Nitrospirae bacterium]|nr:sxtJ [Nitrospirota bacterium]
MAIDPHAIPELDRAGLRRFGLTTGAIVCGLFGLLLPLLAHKALVWVAWPWALAGVLGLWALAAPATLRPVYRGWMRVGAVLGFVNTRIILAVMFYLVLVPVGLVMRRVARDPMARRFDEGANSYRVRHDAPPKERMEKPY